MKNQYVGDIGDYSKLGLISTLISLDQNIKLGINWYQFDGIHHTESPNDGKHYEYLTGKRKDSEKLSRLFPEIYEEFKAKFTININGEIEIFEENRKVENLEKVSCLENTLFFNANICDLPRDSWFNNSLTALSEAEIVFLDPDNGLEYSSGRGGVKHVLIGELEKYYLKGKSVIL